MRVTIEGPTVGPEVLEDGCGITPLVVEPDRVVLGVARAADGTGPRLLTFSEGTVRIDGWERHDPVGIDDRQARAGYRLVRRVEDRTGRRFGPTSTWHVSDYQTIGTTPATPVGP